MSKGETKLAILAARKLRSRWGEDLPEVVEKLAVSGTARADHFSVGQVSTARLLLRAAALISTMNQESCGPEEMRKRAWETLTQQHPKQETIIAIIVDTVIGCLPMK